MRKLITSAAALLVLVSFTATAIAAGRPAWYPPEEVVKAAVEKQKAAEEAGKAYYQREIIAQYEKHSEQNAAWDDRVRAMLDVYIQQRLRPSADADLMMIAACNRCVSVHCEDPLFSMLFLRVIANQPGRPSGQYTGQLVDVSQRMLNQGYTGILRFHALASIADNKAREHGPARNDQASAIAEPFLNDAMAELKEIAKAQDLPAAELARIFTTASVVSKSVYGDEWTWTEQVYAELEKLLPARRSDLLAAKGRFYVDYAWAARGNGFANTVTEDGWRKMKERLAIAEKACTQAWQLDQNCLVAAQQMMTVELGQGKGKGVMEMWFKRAVAIDPHNIAVYEAKRNYLEPKWHGSEREMMAFARQVAATLPKSEPARLVLLNAHTALATRSVTGMVRRSDIYTNYIESNPDAWPEVRAVADDLLEASTLPQGQRLILAMMAIPAKDRQAAARYLEGIPEELGQTAFGEEYTWIKSEIGAK